MCTVEETQDIVDSAIRAQEDRQMRRVKWIIGILLSIALATAGVGISGTVRLIQNDTLQKTHMSDGHPESVKRMIKLQEEQLHAQGLILTEIRTNQGFILDDIGEIKKKLNSVD